MRCFNLCQGDAAADDESIKRCGDKLSTAPQKTTNRVSVSRTVIRKLFTFNGSIYERKQNTTESEWRNKSVNVRIRFFVGRTQIRSRACNHLVKTRRSLELLVPGREEEALPSVYARCISMNPDNLLSNCERLTSKWPFVEMSFYRARCLHLVNAMESRLISL